MRQVFGGESALSHSVEAKVHQRSPEMGIISCFSKQSYAALDILSSGLVISQLAVVEPEIVKRKSRFNSEVQSRQQPKGLQMQFDCFVAFTDLTIKKPKI